MTPQSRKVLALVLRVMTDKKSFFFWLFVRFVSAILPLITVYQFSRVVGQLQDQAPLNDVFLSIAAIFLLRILDNHLRLRSITRLEHAISNISFSIHNYFLSDLDTKSKEERHATVQAVRNFADAFINTANLIKQPGIDSLVSLTFIPTILYILDFKIFVISVSYILIYYFVDFYTTQHYARLKDNLNTKTETYYAKVQDSNDFDLEQKAYTRHHHRLSNWNYTEWFHLQNSAVFFYSLILMYLVYSVTTQQNDISGLVLVTGYASQLQAHLNSFSHIQDSLSDMFIGLQHLAKNNSVSVIDLDDLI